MATSTRPSPSKSPWSGMSPVAPKAVARIPPGDRATVKVACGKAAGWETGGPAFPPRAYAPAGVAGDVAGAGADGDRAVGQVGGELDQVRPIGGHDRGGQDVVTGVEQVDGKAGGGPARQAGPADVGDIVPQHARVVGRHHRQR